MIKLWAGSQESFDVVLAAEVKVAEGLKVGMWDDNSDLPPLWEARGSTAVINISGSLIDGAAGFMRYFGVVGYDDIIKATIEAATDPDMKSLLFHINSPGGEVNGVIDTAKVLNQITALKNSSVYTSSVMASGGYWLGSAINGTIAAGPTAKVGSIGVLTVLTNVEKALEIQGVKKTILRAGDQKALNNPYEPLSDQAKANIQQDLNDVHSLFRAAVAKGRPNLSAADLVDVTQGQEFMGKRALTAGLVDKVSSFDVALKLLDSTTTASNTPQKSKGSTMKTVLTEAHILQIAAGASLESLGLKVETTAEPTEAATAAAVAAAALVADTAAKAAEEAAKTTTKVEAVTASTEVVDLLKSQLLTAQAELVTTKAELINVKATHQTASANHDGLLQIAREAVGKMSIALGGTDAASTTLDAAGAIAEHARVSAVFKEKFKVGGVAVKTPAAGAAEPEDEKTRAFRFGSTIPPH
jgi:signal peptide peptidase SppA